MISVNAAGTVDFEKVMETWKDGKLTEFINMNTEKKDAVCRLICQGVEIFRKDITAAVNKELRKKAFGKYLEVKDISVYTVEEKFFLTADVQVRALRKAEGMKEGAVIAECGIMSDPYLPGAGLFTWILEKAVSSAANNTEKMEKILIKTINSRIINKKIMDTVSAILKEKKIPVEVETITCT